MRERHYHIGMLEAVHYGGGKLYGYAICFNLSLKSAGGNVWLNRRSANHNIGSLSLLHFQRIVDIVSTMQEINDTSLYVFGNV